MNAEAYDGWIENKMRYPHQMFNFSFVTGQKTKQPMEKIIIQLNINDFDANSANGITAFQYKNLETVLTNHIWIINVPLGKLYKKWYSKITLSKLEKYLLYIKMSQKEDLVKDFVKGDDVLMKIEEIRESLKNLSPSEQWQVFFDKDEEDEREKYLIKQTCMRIGREEGEKEGKMKEKYTIAKALKEENLPTDKIVKCTGLAIDEIAKL